MKFYSITLYLLVLFIFNCYSQEKGETNQKNWEIATGLNAGSPVTLGINKRLGKRFVTGIYTGTYIGLFDRHGGEIGVDNKIFLRKKKTPGELRNWYWHQALSYRIYNYPTYLYTGSYGIYPIATNKRESIDGLVGVGRSMYITGQMGINLHFDFLYRYVLQYNDDDSGKFFEYYPSIGMFIFYRF